MTTSDRTTGPFHTYLDGFNLYYGALADTDLKWLDVVRLAAEIAGETPDLVRYFSARVKSLPWNPHGHQRQDVYWQALRALKVDIVEGQFLVLNRWKRLAGEPISVLSAAPKHAQVTLPEEKGSDVNLATMMLVDAYEANLRRALVVTNDSDLVKPIEQLMRLGVDVTIANPHKSPAKALRSIEVGGRSPEMKPIFPQAIARCQLPDPVVDPKSGRRIGRPKEWGRKS